MTMIPARVVVTAQARRQHLLSLQRSGGFGCNRCAVYSISTTSSKAVEGSGVNPTAANMLSQVRNYTTTAESSYGSGAQPSNVSGGWKQQQQQQRYHQLATGTVPSHAGMHRIRQESNATKPALHPLHRARFSTAAASTSSTQNEQSGENKQKTSSSNDGGNDGKSSESKSSSSSSFSDYFFDNLGKIFLLAIASIIGTLVRGSYNTSNRNKIRDWIETTSALDPLEIDDLRMANSEFTKMEFTTIMNELYDGDNYTNSSSSANDDTTAITYDEFVKRVRTVMIKLKGEAYTIQLGHLLDRVVAALVTYYAHDDNNDASASSTATSDAGSSSNTTMVIDSSSSSSSDGITNMKTINELELPISLWLTVLSLAVYSTAEERIDLLYQVLLKERQVQQQGQEVSSSSETTSSSTDAGDYASSRSSSSSSARSSNPTLRQVVNMVGYLQRTCQLVPDTQVINIPEEYIPTQKFQIATSQQLVEAATHVPVIAEAPYLTSEMSHEDFALLLTTKPVCAWGECYQK